MGISVVNEMRQRREEKLESARRLAEHVADEMKPELKGPERQDYVRKAKRVILRDLELDSAG